MIILSPKSADFVRVYLFRDDRFAPTTDTWVSAAPLDIVVDVFGGGGIKQTAGLSKIFGGAAVFENERTGSYYLGVWGARKASKFRGTLRSSGYEISIIRARPPGRLAWYQTQKQERRAQRA
ncbi:MAG TPA: hypothetical protein VKB67_04295 [Rhizomicrobium sp.]|nr:hypothetical protein [Rhizomicrobium sp.]